MDHVAEARRILDLCCTAMIPAGGYGRLEVHLSRALRQAQAAAYREAAARLHTQADRYEKDGEPGPLGYNCWGWRDIAATLRREAAALAADAGPDGG